jgi:hypothetical protein
LLTASVIDADYPPDFELNRFVQRRQSAFPTHGDVRQQCMSFQQL